ncbi:MAG: hypothetical protein ACFCU5_17830 [Pleurocapsa sp.]
MQNLDLLYPRAIGYLHNKAIAAWYNYHRLELRNDKGNILFVFERESEFGFINQVAIVLNRYLIIAIGALCVFGLKVYDLENFQWLWDNIKINSGEIGLLAIHPTKPIIAIEGGKQGDKPGFS